MTIHRAKGLEFDKVIVPGLGRRMRGNSEPLLRWLELPREPEGSDLLMAPIPQAARRGMEPLNEYLKSLQIRRAAHEKARLLYVAATRARTALHWFAELPESKSDDEQGQPLPGTLLATLWPAIAAEFPRQIEAAAGASAEQALQAPRAPLFERLPADWHLPRVTPGPAASAIPIASYEAEEEGDRAWSADSNRCLARVVREQLCGFARHGTLPLASAVGAFQPLLRERLSRVGLVGDDLEHCVVQGDAIVAACLTDRQFLWMFDRDNRDSISPLHLTGLHEGRLTSIAIDHSFVDRDGTRWLVDFSLEMPADADLEDFLKRERVRHRASLEKSVLLASRLGPEPVRAGIYFPFARAFITASTPQSHGAQ
jgi:hypothetical protein